LWEIDQGEVVGGIQIILALVVDHTKVVRLDCVLVRQNLRET
jgi:hypothetical protein